MTLGIRCNGMECFVPSSSPRLEELPIWKFLYSKIVDANGNPIWHTTVLTNGGWDTDYLPVLTKDHLVASAEIRDGVLAFANLYLGKYYLVERATGIVLPVDGNGQYYVSCQYPVLDRTLTPTADGLPQVREGRVVQARVTAVAEKSIRLEVFGVECSVLARDLSWEWICDAHDLYTVGDVLLARIRAVDASDPAHIRVEADPRGVTENPMEARLRTLKEQSRYAGQVTDVRRGIIYLRLHNGVNAIAHNCLDKRAPAKRDQVSFVLTHINRDQAVAVGIITRIIRQVY